MLRGAYFICVSFAICHFSRKTVKMWRTKNRLRTRMPVSLQASLLRCMFIVHLLASSSRTAILPPPQSTLSLSNCLPNFVPCGTRAARKHTLTCAQYTMLSVSFGECNRPEGNSHLRLFAFAIYFIYVYVCVCACAVYYGMLLALPACCTQQQ